MRAALEAATYFAVACVLVFLWGVTRLLPWWRRDSEPTRSMVSLSAAFLLLLVPSVLHYAVGWTLTDTAFAWFYFGGLCLIGLIHLWRYFTFRRIQREGRRSRG